MQPNPKPEAQRLELPAALVAAALVLALAAPAAAAAGDRSFHVTATEGSAPVLHAVPGAIDLDALHVGIKLWECALNSTWCPSCFEACGNLCEGCQFKRCVCEVSSSLWSTECSCAATCAGCVVNPNRFLAAL